MVFPEKHQRFVNNGLKTLQTLHNIVSSKVFNQMSIVDEYYHISKKYSIIKEDVIGVSKMIYNDMQDDMKPVVNRLHEQYMNSPIASYIAPYVSLGTDCVSEIKRDIHPLSESTQEQLKSLNNKHFLTIGITCFLLSGITLQFNSNNNSIVNHNIDNNGSVLSANNENNEIESHTSKSFNFNIDFTKPKSNPTNELVQALKPKFMTSIFHSKLEAFTKLLGMTEGKANFFYPDNLGIATAYGWNPSKNSKDFNVNIAHKIGMTTSQVKSIEKISANSTVQSVPKSLKKVVLSDKQIQKSAELLMVFYEEEFMKVMKIKAKENNIDYQKALSSYNHLPNNQQAVMVHMAYKVGTSNLLKYDIFFKKLFTYMEHPTNTNLIKVTDNFEYSYKTRAGERLHDKRVEATHNDFFNECSINDSEKKQKQIMKARVKSCRELVASRTVNITNKITNKG